MRRTMIEIMVAGMVFAASLGGALAHQASPGHRVAPPATLTATV